MSRRNKQWHGPQNQGGAMDLARTPAPGISQKQPASPVSVVGVPGVTIWGGVVYEEWMKALKSGKATKLFIEMEDDPVIGALLDAIKMPLLSAEFSVPPQSEEQADIDAAKFLESCMDDMTSYSWRQHVDDMLSMLTFGYSISEIVLKKRAGSNGKPTSKYNDGLLGLHILDPRGQETLYRWVLDEEYNVAAFVQSDPVTGQIIEIPKWKLLHATFRSRKRNPQGRSPLRTLYNSYRTRTNLEAIEGIGSERDMAGLPVMRLPQGLHGQELTDAMAKAQRVVASVRMDEEAGVVLPPPPVGSTDKWEFTLATGGGSKAYDVRKIVNDLDKRIMMRYFAQFLFLGMGEVGTQALVQGSHDFFQLALRSVQNTLLEAWNDQLVPLLFRVNPFPNITELPEIEWSEAGKVDAVAIANLLDVGVRAGVITPDPALEDHLRDVSGLPDRPEGVGEGPREPVQNPFLPMTHYVSARRGGG